MQICSEIGGFTLAEADNMRRAMGKKKKDIMASYKIQFVEGAEKNNVAKNIAIEIFELLEKFAEYGFVKSHSTAYAIIAYQTAWLKYYYPIEFLTANISSNINDTDNVVKLIADGRRMGLLIQHPDINSSEADFTIINSKTMSYGLAAIKNVGYKAAEQIVEHRKENGHYKNIFELATSGKQAINKKVIESLILVGACNSLQNHRAELFSSLERILEFSSKFYKNINRNQENLFSSISEASIQYPTLDQVDQWPVEKELKYEKELLGFYLSNNPLSKYEDDFIELSSINSEGISKFGGEKVQIGGIVSSAQLRYDKNGNQWAILNLDTYSGSLQVYVFHNIYLQYIDLVKEDNIIFIRGKISNQSENNHVTQIIAEKIFNVDKIRSRLARYVNIRFEHNNNDKLILDKILELGYTYKGDINMMLHMTTSNKLNQRIQVKKFLVSPDQEFLNKLRLIIGKSNVWLS